MKAFLAEVPDGNGMVILPTYWLTTKKHICSICLIPSKKVLQQQI